MNEQRKGTVMVPFFVFYSVFHILFVPSQRKYENNKNDILT